MTIRLAIAGMAHPHVSYLFEELPHRPDVTLVAVSDPDEGLRTKYAGQAGVPGYADHRDMLAAHDVDVVSTVGVFGHRGAAVVDALRAGAHVLADKPLCTDLGQLAEIEKVAAETGRHVSVIFEKRWYPATLAVRRLIADGVLGDLALVASTGPHKLIYDNRPAWFFRREEYGGILNDLGVHDIDIVLALSGATSGTVSGLAANNSLPQHDGFTDNGALLLRADGSGGPVTATIDAHYLNPKAAPFHGHYRMRLVGTRGTAELDWARHQLDVVTDDRPPWTEELPPGLRPAEEFFTALLAGRDPEVTTAISIAATRVALLAQRSADSGGTLETW